MPVKNFIRQFEKSGFRVSDAAWKKINAAFQPHTLPKGSILLTPGEVSEKLYFMKTGIARVFYERNGQDIISSLEKPCQILFGLNTFYLPKTMKTNLLMLFLLMGVPVFAQLPQKGDWMVGADVANLTIFDITGKNRSKVTAGNIALLGGKFVSKSVVLGAAVPVEWLSYPNFQNSGRETTLAYGLIPFARFYLTDTRLRPYLSVGAGYVWSQYRGQDGEISHNGFAYNANAGLAYFLSRQVSLDAVVNFTGQPYQAANGFPVMNDNRLNFQLRFQVFLGK